MSVIQGVLHSARARQQEMKVIGDDLWFALRRGGRPVRGRGTGVDDLATLSRTRWRGKEGAPLHVLYVGQPWNWEEHNLAAERDLKPFVSSWWMRDAGLTDYEAGWLAGRERTGEALYAHIKALQATRPVHIVIAYLSGSQVLPDHLVKLRELGVITCGFNWDDRLYFAGRRVDGVSSGPAGVATAFDLNLTNCRRSLTKYAVIGARALFWPEAANPDFFKPQPTEPVFDLSFVGGAYGPRADVVHRLQREGFRVNARGPGWPGGEVPADQIPAVIGSARLALGFSGIGRSLRITCLKGRDFEAPMCGVAYMPSWNPELSLVYDVGSEIVPWRNYSDLRMLAAGLLADESRLTKIRDAGLARARRDHTWARRVEELCRLLGHPWRASTSEVPI